MFHRFLRRYFLLDALLTGLLFLVVSYFFDRLFDGQPSRYTWPKCVFQVVFFGLWMAFITRWLERRRKAKSEAASVGLNA